MIPGAAGLAGASRAAVVPDEADEREGTVRRRSDPDDDPDPDGRPDAAAMLREDEATWAGDGASRAEQADDRVPRIRPEDDPDDMSGWDDVSDSAWLTGTPAADDPTEG